MKASKSKGIQFRKKVKSTDLEVEQKAIIDMVNARKYMDIASLSLSSALSKRCFAKHRIENRLDVEALSKCIDDLVDIRDILLDVLEPYLVFHDADETMVLEWELDFKRQELGDE
jgi:hypothetical protein